MVKVVTAFTLSHSITLSLAALDLVNLPGGLVEPLIAASVVAVAVENFFNRRVDRRWRVAFFLGFIHGFGFAGALLDIGLPAGDGFSVIRRVKSLGPIALTPIIVITALDAFTNKERALEAGAKAFFQKPIDIDGLLAAIEKALQ